MSTPNDAGFPVGTFPLGTGEAECGLPTSDLLDAASQFQTVTKDGQSFTRRSVSDLIALDKYTRSRCRTGSGWGSMGIAKVVPPDALGN